MRVPLAVLIDAENISSLLFEPLKEMVEAIGAPVVWQLHGDFFSWPHPGWQEVAQREGIELRHQFHSGKNASDIAMTIAAMDLLHAGKSIGTAVGWIQLGGNIFGLAAPIATGYIVAATGSFTSAFLLAGALLVIGGVITLTMTRRPVGAPQPAPAYAS